MESRSEMERLLREIQGELVLNSFKLEVVLKELEQAEERFPEFRSLHEGYAIVLEEVEELWSEIKAKNRQEAYHEAVQLAAMALRFLNDFEKMVSQ